MAAAWTEYTSTLTNSTVTIPAKVGRKELIIGNPSDTVMTVALNGTTATASVGIPVAAGTAIRLGQSGGDGKGNTCPETAVSVFCAGTAKAYYIAEC